MDRLRRVIGNRSVAVFCQGPSISFLEDKHLPSYVCYASMNRWMAAEKRILWPRGLQSQVLFSAALPRISEEWENIKEFIEQPLDCVYLTRPTALRHFVTLLKDEGNEFIKLNRHRILPLICEGDRFTPPEDAVQLYDPAPFEVLTVGTLVAVLLKSGVQRISVFGADGGEARDGQMYYGEEGYGDKNIADGRRTIPRDTVNLSAGWKSLEHLSKGEDGEKGFEARGKVVNANPESKLTCWEIVSIEEGLEWLGA